MLILQSTIIRALEWLFGPFKRVDPFWVLLGISLVMMLAFLEVFRRTTDSAKLQEAKNSMQARLLEVRLFKDSPTTVLSALAGMLTCNLQYLKHSLKPTVFMLPPLLVLMIHLDTWFGHAPLHPGQAALVRVKVLDSAPQTLDDVSMETPAGLTIETPALRIPQEYEVSWVVRANRAGRYLLTVTQNGGRAQKAIVVTDGSWERAVPRVVTSGFWNQWIHPGEALLPKAGPIEWIEVSYPDRSVAVLGWKTHWLVLFFVFSCVLGFMGSRLLRVTI